MGLRSWWQSTGQPHDPLRIKALSGGTPLFASTPRTQPARQVRPIIFNGSPRGVQRTPMVNDSLQQAVKSISYSDYVNDFINNTGFYEGDHYTKQQVEAAYRTSVYLFAALRRVANLFSDIRIVGEQKESDGTWKRLPEGHHLNTIFSAAGANFMRELYLYYAMYGKTLVYKRKTKRARAAYKQHKLITNYLDGGIAGLHIIPNVKWEADEDEFRSEIRGFRLNEPDGALESGMRDRDEFVYLHDFDFRNRIDAVSMVSLALNNAITNAAIARWAAHYFMSGAMPLLLVMPEEDSPAIATEADLLKYKSLIERIWQGLWGKFSLRAAFLDRKLHVEKAGITAEDVQAPELNRDALNAITSVFQIAPDLIVPPEGGTQDRHKWLIRDAFTAAVLPVAWQFVTAFNADFGFDEHSPLRLVIDEESITALEAERADNADTELKIFEGGVQSYGEVQERLKVRKTHDEFDDWLMIGGKFQSPARLKRDDQSPDPNMIQYATQAWDSGILTLSEIRKLMFSLPTPPDVADGFKWQVVPEPASGGGGFGGGAPGGGETPPGGDTPPDDTLPPTGGNTPPTSGTQPPAAQPTPSATRQDPKPTAPNVDPTPGKQGKPDGDKALDVPAARQRPAPPNALPVTSVPASVVLNESGALTVTEVNTSTSVEMVAPAEEATSAGEGDQDRRYPASEPNPAYICLWCADDPLIAGVRGQLEVALKGIPVEWNDPATWHITLVSLLDVNDDALRSAGRLLPAQCPALHLRATNVSTFEPSAGSSGKRPVILQIEMSDGLRGLQSAAYAACSAQGVALSPFSAPDSYVGHMTFGYVPEETDVPEFTCQLVIEPKALRIARSDTDGIDERPSIVAIQNSLSASDFEADGTDQYSYDPINRAVREQWLADTMRTRERMRSALSLWQTLGEPGAGLRDNVQVAVRTALAESGDDKPRAWAAIFAACDAGQFDEHADLEENPIRIGSEAVQPTAEAELNAWEKFAVRPHKAARPFKTNLLPDALAAQVTAGLAKATNIKGRRAVFSDARAALSALQPDSSSEAMLSEWADRVRKNANLSHLLPNDAA